VFDVGKDVRQNLAGVKFVGQAVDDGHAGMLGKALDFGLLISANHHQINHAADDFGAVFNRLGSAQLAAVSCQMNNRTTHLVHAGFKTHAGTGGGFFKNHSQGTVSQGLMFFVGFEFFLDKGGTLENISVLCCC
jgi:hypothetical protein